MSLQKISFLMQVTTQAKTRNYASPRAGGWSEGFWDASGLLFADPKITVLLNARALMLPQQASILGVRAQQYTIDGNKLVPGGAASQAVNKPGSAAYNVNIPQDCMLCSASVVGANNTTHFKLKCIPDEVIETGEFNGDATFRQKMQAYFGYLISYAQGSVLRDFSKPLLRVLSVANKVVTLDAVPGGPVGLYFRFKRVRDKNTGKPIQGVFRCTAATGTALTFDDLDPALAAGPGGFMRNDALIFRSYDDINFARSTDGKIGNPFARYRGRRSKRRAG